MIHHSERGNSDKSDSGNGYIESCSFPKGHFWFVNIFIYFKYRGIMTKEGIDSCLSCQKFRGN